MSAYVRLIRFMALRVFASLLMVFGFLGFLTAGIHVLVGGRVEVNGVATTDSGQRLLYVVAFLLPAALGLFLWRIYSYRKAPSEKDTPAKNPWE